MIDDLPPAARHHTEPGHFQMDTVHSSGGRGGILTLVDPNYGDPTALRRFYMYALPTISQASVTSALRCFRRDLRANGHELKTILTDNGSEFLHEDTLEALLHVPIYYCHPYSACSSSTTHTPPKRSPNPCVCFKSSQTHCANLLTFYRVHYSHLGT